MSVAVIVIVQENDSVTSLRSSKGSGSENHDSPKK